MRLVSLACTLLICVVSVPAMAADPHLGRSLAATCANCHGTDGKTQGTDLVTLAGMPANQMLGKLNEFKEGTRQATIMPQIVKGFTNEQLKLIADYFAKQR
jgi:cytochrome c553